MLNYSTIDVELQLVLLLRRCGYTVIPRNQGPTGRDFITYLQNQYPNDGTVGEKAAASRAINCLRASGLRDRPISEMFGAIRSPRILEFRNVGKRGAEFLREAVNQFEAQL